MDVYKQVTDTIVRAIENDPGDVTLPWHRSGGGIPKNATNDTFYNGINIVYLWCVAQERNYSTANWATYKQWKEIGAHVRKGEKSSLIVFYKQVIKENQETGEDDHYRFLRHYYVFNADQVDGYTPAELKGDPIDRIEKADQYTKKTGAIIHHGGHTACYRPATDAIHIPDERRFFATEHSTRTEAYYSVVFHELTHWTGAIHRLDRDLKNRFGTEAYAMEELVAELGAAYQCARLGITPEPRLDHAQYIKNWMQVLKDDPKAIFSAAAKAQEAVNFLMGNPS